MSTMKKCRHCNGTGKVHEAVETGLEMRRRRERASIGLREMARKLGFNAGYVSYLEHGKRAWSYDMIDAYNAVIEAAQ